MWPTFPELGGLSVRRDVNRDLSIDNETDDDDASEPRQTGPRVSFSAGKTKFNQCSFPDRRRLFL